MTGVRHQVVIRGSKMRASLLFVTFFILCGCGVEPEPYYVHGVTDYFCVPESRRVNLPLGLYETVPSEDPGFAFSGCTSNTNEYACNIPSEVAGGAVGSLGEVTNWRWKNFSDGSQYRNLLSDLGSNKIRDVQIFDGGNMLMVVTSSNITPVFYWAKQHGSKFKEPAKLAGNDSLVAVCQSADSYMMNDSVHASGTRCNRYTRASEFSLNYEFSLDDMSMVRVQQLDRDLMKAINEWKCRSN